MQQGGLVNNMDWMTSVPQKCYNCLSCLTVITNIVCNYHEVSRNEAMGIGIDICIGDTISVSISAITFESIVNNTG